jgi:glycyl-tRNA synthetase alpha chain
VSVTERVALIRRVRRLAVACAEAYVASRERLGFPLLAAGGRAAESQAAGAEPPGRSAGEGEVAGAGG